MPQTVRLSGGPPELQGKPISEISGTYPLFLIVTDQGRSWYAERGSVLVRIEDAVGYIRGGVASGWDEISTLRSNGVQARLPLPSERIIITQGAGF